MRFGTKHKTKEREIKTRKLNEVHSISGIRNVSDIAVGKKFKCIFE